MKMHTLAGAGATALLLGAFTAGGMTLAGSRDVGKEAASAAGRASRALSKNDAAHAVGYAESAVTLSPRDASFRMLLGQSYLKAGRFASAGQAFADVLTLSGESDAAAGKAALNLALVQIAQGDAATARATLAAHADAIPGRDRGLALALAGDPAGGVELLTVAVRTPDADARTRQNLGLALALAGRWGEARTVISGDMTPEEANTRIMGWLEFARSKAPSDQVATLLGVTAAKDGGQPAALALAAPPVVVPEAAAPTEVAAAPVPAPEVAAAEPAPASDAAPAVVETAQAVPPAQPVATAVVFGERREIVQALPAAAPRPARPTRSVPVIAVRGAYRSPVSVAAPAKGTWYVQLGAYDNAGVARDAWARATRRYAALSQQTPAGMAFRARTGAFYRLSVGGFARADAVALCRGIRAKGGSCFVRTGAGDQVAQWATPARVRTAARVRVARPRDAGVQVATR